MFWGLQAILGIIRMMEAQSAIYVHALILLLFDPIASPGCIILKLLHVVLIMMIIKT